MSLPNSNSYALLGGELSYDPPPDPTVDVPADASNETRSDVAAMTRMCPRAVFIFTNNVGNAIVLHDSVWGNDISVRPTLLRNGPGDFTVTWPTTVTDARGVTRALNFRWGMANIEDDANAAWANAIRVSPNVFRVITQDVTTNGPDDLSSINITLMVW